MTTRILAAVFAVSIASACGLPNAPPPGELVKSDKARITAAAPAADVDQTVDDTTAFAFDIYRKLSADENLAFSPYSVVTALSMTYPGAKGATKTAFEQTMHLTLPADRYHRAMNTIDLALESRGQGASGKDGKPFRLRSNNQLFAQKGLTLVPEFLDVLAQEYGSGVRLLDFVTKPEPARKSINEWIDTNTEHLIPELLKQGTITSDTRLALVNTLYFNAAWKKPFEHNKTAPGSFTLSDGSKIQVSMMAGEDLAVRHANVAGTDVLELPYSGDEVSMLVIAPPVGKLAELEQGLDGAKVRQFVGALQDRNVGVKLPKFEARTQARLDDILKALGLGIAFTGDADFSGMTPDEQLAITAVVHEAVVKTDEAGTEAAAATAVIVGRVSVPEYLEINRPFVYLIRDRATGAVLFVGRIARPASIGT